MGRSLKTSLLIFFLIHGVVCVLAAASPTNTDNLFKETEEAWRNGNLEHAVNLLDEAYSWYADRGDSSGLAIVHTYFTNTYREKSDFEQARYHAYKAIDLSRRHDTGNYHWHVYNNLGAMARQQAYYDEAIGYYSRILDNITEIEDSTIITTAHQNLGVVYTEIENFQEAINSYNYALELSKALGDSTTLATVTGNIGVLYNELGEHRQALQQFYNQLELRLKTGNRHALPIVKNNIGYTYRQVGEFDEALKYYSKGRQLALELGRVQLVVRINNNMGQVYQSLNQHDRAIRYYRANRDYLDELNSFSLQSSILRNLASTYRWEDRHDEAMQYKRKNLGLALQNGSNSHISQSYLSIASQHYFQQNFESAYHFADLALNYAEESGVIRKKLNALLQLARIAHQQGDHLKVDRYLEKAKEYANNQLSLRLLTNYVKTVLDVTDPADPYFFTAAEMYMEAVEQKRKYLHSSSELRSSFFTEHAPRYKKIAEAYLKQGEAAEAFEIIERSRARVLVEDIQRSGWREQLSEEQYLEIQTLRRRITERYEEIEHLTDYASRDSLMEVIDNIKAEKEALRASLLEKHDRQITITPATLSEISGLADTDTAILTYLKTDSNIWGIAIFKEQTHSWKIDNTDPKNPEQLLEQFRDAIEREHPLPIVNRYGRLLARTLLDPAAEILDAADHLIINPGGSLAGLPFDALIYNGNYLIDSFTISTVPTLTVLKMREQREAQSYARDLFTIANPDFRPQKLDDALAITELRRVYENQLTPLPASQIEAERIGALFSDNTLITREDAHKRNIAEAELEQYRFIHFATHGFIHREFPELSGLALSYGDGGIEFLRSHEISSLALPSEMVVLSACETAVGPHITGEGTLGLQRAFLTAGSRSVVASLWRVYDQSTAKLMVRFYSQIKGLETQGWNWFAFSSYDRHDATRQKAKAMRSAKISMINSSEYYHPVHWAAFTVTGY